MHSISTSCLCLLFAWTSCCVADNDRLPDRYNIITIVTDDQARWSLGAYGNPEARTPNLDRLADDGAKFLNAFVPTPVCSPSRVSFFTGLYGTQVGITDFLNRQEEHAGLGLPDSAVTWPAVLQQHGYATGLIGKWHLGTQPQFHPTRHGFDHFFGWLLTPKSIDPVLEVDGKNRPLKGSLPDLLVDKALRFVAEQRRKPFALVVTFLAPHHPYGPVLEVDAAPFENLDPKVPDFPGNDDWKLVRFYRANMLDELYDLRSDPGELHNRYNDASTSDVRQRLRRKLEAWMRSIDDPLLSDKKYDLSVGPTQRPQGP